MLVVALLLLNGADPARKNTFNLTAREEAGRGDVCNRASSAVLTTK